VLNTAGVARKATRWPKTAYSWGLLRPVVKKVSSEEDDKKNIRIAKAHLSQKRKKNEWKSFSEKPQYAAICSQSEFLA